MREIDMKAIAAHVLPVNSFLIYGDTKCISGDAFIGYQVRTPEGELQNSKGGSLARLFHRFHRLRMPGKGAYQRKQSIDSEFWAPSMTEDGRLFQNKILDVIDSGVRECVRIRTVGGSELVCTPDHPLATDSSEFGFRLAADLDIASSILMHKHVPWTIESEERERVHRPEIYVKHHPLAPTKIVRDPSRGYEHAYKRLIRARAVYEAHMNGLTLEAYVARLNDGALEGLTFLDRNVDVHHQDENKLNDVPSNLVALSRAEHMRHHFVLPNGRPRSGSYVAVEDRILSIESAGKHQTYDIKMAGPFHNFVADDFIVHNSGKTTFAGTSPRPLILADGSEHGYESLREENWNDDATPLFEPDVRPVVWAIDKETDIHEAVEKARPFVEAKVFLTVWVDSITFISDLVFNNILMSQGKRDNRQAYGELGVRLRNIRIKIASLGVSHGWLALAKHPGEDDPVGRPMIPGQQSDKFAAGVDYVWHSRINHPNQNKPADYDIHTKRYLNHVAGSRLGARADMMPEPFRGTFADYLATIGCDVDAIRASFPPIAAARANAQKIAATRAKAAASVPAPVPAPAPVVAQGSQPGKVPVIRPVANGKAATK